MVMEAMGSRRGVSRRRFFGGAAALGGAALLAACGDGPTEGRHRRAPAA
ncbi:hypothetical protein [Tsukamurella sp. PLM1]|nr:hypothetical protein [Tsukamurella sp. PLM1]